MMANQNKLIYFFKKQLFFIMRFGFLVFEYSILPLKNVLNLVIGDYSGPTPTQDTAGGTLYLHVPVV